MSQVMQHLQGNNVMVPGKRQLESKNYEELMRQTAKQKARLIKMAAWLALVGPLGLASQLLIKRTEQLGQNLSLVVGKVGNLIRSPGLLSLEDLGPGSATCPTLAADCSMILPSCCYKGI